MISRSGWNCMVWLLMSVCFNMLVYVSGDLLFYWVFLELGGLCLIPVFRVSEKSWSGLLLYILASSFSSVLMLMGLLLAELFFVMFVGLLMKFGVFPFVGWVYGVVCGSQNWWVTWWISTVAKIPVLSLSFIFSGVGGFMEMSELLVFVGLIYLSWFFWLGSYKWFSVWCHMMLSSSCVLFVLALVGGVESLGIFMLVYMVWGSCVMLYFSFGLNSVVGYSILLLSYPWSISLYYKLYMCYLLVGVFHYYILFAWVMYSISEQVWLYTWLKVNLNSRVWVKFYGG